MEIFPAIDVLDNKVVRLKKGDYNQVTIYNESARDQAQQFASLGARWLHIVDLEGARSGVPTQLDTIATIIKETGLKIEVGGGIRSLESIEKLEQAGVSRVVLGTKIINDPEFLGQAIERFGDLICAGVDALNGEIAIQGWQEQSGKNADEFISALRGQGVKHIVFTDISRDGMQSGIDAKLYEHIASLAGFSVTASGGISTLDDIKALARLGDDVIEAIIVGRALYERSFSVDEALQVLRDFEV